MANLRTTRMFGKNKTPLFAARFLALAAISAVSADAGSQWIYSEDRTAESLSYNAAASANVKGVSRAVLRFRFQTKDQCATTVSLAIYAFGNQRGKYLSSAVVPEEWAVQVDEQAPEQGQATDIMYSSSFEIFLPVSSALVADAKSGSRLQMWQTGTGKYPPPPERRTHVELTLPGIARQLERAEASCVAALAR